MEKSRIIIHKAATDNGALFNIIHKSPNNIHIIHAYMQKWARLTSARRLGKLFLEMQGKGADTDGD